MHRGQNLAAMTTVIAVIGCVAACGTTSDTARSGASQGTTSTDGGPCVAPAEPVASPVVAGPERLKSYAEIRAALTAGFRVRSFVNYKRCKKDGGPGVDATSSSEIDTFELQTPASGPSFIDVGKTTLAWIYFTDGYEYLWDYGRIRFNEDGSSSVRAQYYRPVTFEQVLDEEFTCSLDVDGAADGAGGISFFKEAKAPRPLETFDALVTTLNGGASAHALVDFVTCQKLENGKVTGAGPAVIERIPFALNEYFGKSVIGNPAAFVATSQSSLHLTDGAPIANRYAKLRVSAAGSASVLVMQNKPGSLSPLSTAEYRCPIASDAKPGGVSLFGL
jgi:hypothetical protein